MFYHLQNDLMYIISYNPQSPVKCVSLLGMQCLYFLEEATSKVLKYVLVTYIVYTIISVYVQSPVHHFLWKIWPTPELRGRCVDGGLGQCSGTEINTRIHCMDISDGWASEMRHYCNNYSSKKQSNKFKTNKVKFRERSLLLVVLCPMV